VLVVNKSVKSNGKVVIVPTSALVRSEKDCLNYLVRSYEPQQKPFRYKIFKLTDS